MASGIGHRWCNRQETNQSNQEEGFWEKISEVLDSIPQSALQSKTFESIAFIANDSLNLDHYQAFHFSWTEFSLSIYDNSQKASNEPSYEDFGFVFSDLNLMCTKLKQLFDEYAYLLSNDVKLKGSFSTVKKKEDGSFIWVAKPVFYQFHPEDGDM